MPGQHDDDTDVVGRAAIAWYARIKEPTATPADHADFAAWLDADPAHRRAMEAVDGLWRRVAEPAARLGAGGWYRPAARVSSPRATLRFAGAGAVLLAVTLLGLWWHDPGLADRAFADHATAPGRGSEVVLADGSRAYLDGDSAIALRFTATAREVRLLRGRVWFDVTPDAARRFTVRAEAVEARVLGTAFAVERVADSVTVTVRRGRVAVAASGHPDAALSPGESLRIAAGVPMRPVSVDPDIALAWRRGVVVFDRATLATVIEALNRMAPGRVLLTDAGLGQMTLSGAFRTDDPEAVLGALRSGLGLRTTRLLGLATLIHR